MIVFKIWWQGELIEYLSSASFHAFAAHGLQFGLNRRKRSNIKVVKQRDISVEAYKCMRFISGV